MAFTPEMAASGEPVTGEEARTPGNAALDRTGADPDLGDDRGASPGSPRGPASEGAGSPSAAPSKGRSVLRPERAAFIALSVISLAGLGAFAAYWFRHPDWAGHPVVMAVVTFIAAFWLATHQGRWYLLPLMKRPDPAEPLRGERVGVATTFVPGGESRHMLARTVRALVAMRGPHDTWVLDEGDDPEVRALCERLGARHFSRKERPEYQAEKGPFEAGTKHGNYNAWLEELGFDRYDIVVGFDPDHIPDPAFLDRTLGHLRDPSVAYVQAPQVYYNQDVSFIARGAAEETYAYYSETQMALHAAGCPMVTGCHNVHRTRALREVGGLPPHDADDLLVSLLYGYHGWRGVFVPEILAEGLTPVDWSGYLGQQLRWARSVADVKLHAFPRMVGGLPLAERVLSGLHGLYFLQGAVMSLVVALVAALLVSGARPAFLSWETVAWALPVFAALKACDYWRQRFFLDPEREGGVHWRSLVLKLGKWPYLGLALLEVLVGRHRPYALTAKRARPGGGERFLLRPHLAVIGLLAGCWILGRWLGHAPHPAALAAAVGLALVSGLLILTELRSYPPAYDPRGRPERVRPAEPEGPSS